MINYWRRLNCVSSDIAKEWEDIIAMDGVAAYSCGVARDVNVTYGNSEAVDSSCGTRNGTTTGCRRGPAEYKLLLPLSTSSLGIAMSTKTIDGCRQHTMSDYVIDIPLLSLESHQLKHRACHIMREFLNLMLPLTRQPMKKEVLKEFATETGVNVESIQLTKKIFSDINFDKIYDYCVVSTSFYLLHRSYDVMHALLPKNEVLSMADLEMLILACITVASKV